MSQLEATCIKDIPFFTEGRVYIVDNIDSDGDVWVTDDEGDTMFMTLEECVLSRNGEGETCPMCKGVGVC